MTKLEYAMKLEHRIEKLGTSRAAMMEKHATLRAFRDWLKAQPPGDIVL